MILKDIAFSIINGAVNASPEDVIEAYQFINDNFYVDELTPRQLLVLRELSESAKVHTPELIVLL
jgi:hypothetical protein